MTLWRLLRLCGIALALSLWLPVQVQAAPEAYVVQKELPSVALSELPAEAQETLRTIKRGGPFAYQRDGTVFRNFERRLPKKPRGYYREYTVKTPGARNRGARRIISGGMNEYYYTADHYQTFNRIRE